MTLRHCLGRPVKDKPCVPVTLRHCRPVRNIVYLFPSDVVQDVLRRYFQLGLFYFCRHLGQQTTQTHFSESSLVYN